MKLTDDHLAVLQKLADHYGSYWRKYLRQAWVRGVETLRWLSIDEQAALQQIRNSGAMTIYKVKIKPRPKEIQQ